MNQHLGALLTRNRVPLYIGAGALGIVLLGAGLFWRAQSKVNKVMLASSPKGVTVTVAKATTYRASRRYVGTLEPWIEAKVGPQFISAYVDTVLVRPGAKVKRGDVLATLDCRNASATSKAVEMQARALATMQSAIQNQATRVAQLGDGGFVSPNEIEQKAAESASKQAQVLAMQAQMAGTSLQVRDCVLRSPFDGDVSERFLDPGAFARPGMPLVTIVDRSLVRLSTDVPEDDFAAVTPGTDAKVRIAATGDTLQRPITRRAPAADPATRTIHVEIDIPDPEHRYPVFTTAEMIVEVGKATPATELPTTAVSIRGAKATTFVIEGGKAHALTMSLLGESGGSVFVEPSLNAGALVVLEGRALLNEGDAVNAKTLAEPSSSEAQQTAAQVNVERSR